MNTKEITLSVFRVAPAAVGDDPSTGSRLLKDAEAGLGVLKREGLTVDSRTTTWGGALALVVTHHRGGDDDTIRYLARSAFGARAEPYDANRELLADGPLGNVGGPEVTVAAMTLTERATERVIVFLADAMPTGAWNLLLYESIADPCSLARLLMIPTGSDDFSFEVHDVEQNRRIILNTPEELCDLLAFVALSSRYVIRLVTTGEGEIAAMPSRQRLSSVGGRSVATNDTVCIVRCEGQFPPAWKVLKPFARPCAGEAWRRQVHGGPLTPVRIGEAAPRPFDGPPRVVALGFQIIDGRLVGPRDMFDDPDFDEARQTCATVDDEVRWPSGIGGYGRPGGGAAYDAAHTPLARVMERLEGRWETMAE